MGKCKNKIDDTVCGRRCDSDCCDKCMNENNKKKTVKKETIKKETIKKETIKKETIKKETDKKDIVKKEKMVIDKSKCKYIDYLNKQCDVETKNNYCDDHDFCNEIDPNEIQNCPTCNNGKCHNRFLDDGNKKCQPCRDKNRKTAAKRRQDKIDSGKLKKCGYIDNELKPCSVYFDVDESNKHYCATHKIYEGIDPDKIIKLKPCGHCHKREYGNHKEICNKQSRESKKKEYHKNTTTCQGIEKTGHPCKRNAQKNEIYCGNHMYYKDLVNDPKDIINLPQCSQCKKRFIECGFKTCPNCRKK
jgi:hypothetical protein